MKIKTKEDALYEVIEEIVAILNYQSSIPYEHKIILTGKLGIFQELMKDKSE